MLIKIVAVSTEMKTNAKGTSYKALTVDFRDDSNKLSSKTINVFGAQKRTGEILEEASPGQVYEVTAVKNNAGYWDWTDARITTEQMGGGSQVSAAQPAAKSQVTGSSSSGGRGFETPEERAKKQVYIVRQSSLANAVATLSVGVKTPPAPEDVIKVARLYEGYVFDTNVGAEDVVKAPASVADLQDDDIEF